MSMLNAYQAIFLATIVVLVWAGYRARSLAAIPSSEHALVDSKSEFEEARKPVRVSRMAAGSAALKERIQALDKLLDENVLSIEEYVELRKRASS